MNFFINLSLLRRNKRYRLLFLGQSISFIGTMITSVALPYQIYHLTRSTLMVGLLSLAQLFPLLITALWGGALADKHHRRQLLFMTESLLSIGCLLFTWNAYSSTPSIALLFIVSSTMSAITGLHRPSIEGISQQIVAKEDLAQMSAIHSLMFSIAMIAGPALAGLIIARFGLVVTYSVDFFTFFISLLTLILMGPIPKPLASKDQSTFSAIKEGVRFAVTKPILLGSYLVDFLAMIFGMPMALFPAIAESFGGPKALGMLYAAPAVGALLVSFLSGWTHKVKRHGKAIALSAIFWGIAIILFGFMSNLVFALFFLSVAGAFDSISGIFRTTLWNETIPESFRGRLAGIEMISYMSGPKLGDTEAGLVAAAFGITASIVSGGILCVAGVAICCFCLPAFWKYRSKI